MNKEIDSYWDKIDNDSTEALELVARFKQDFPHLTNINTRSQILRAVNLSDTFLEWYSAYKQERAVYLQQPQWMKGSIEGAKQWSDLKELLSTQKEQQKSWDSRVTKKAKELRDTVRQVEEEKNNYMMNAHPLVIIDSLTVRQLPEAQILELVLIGEEKEREKKQRQLVVAMKKKEFEKYITGGEINNPYLNRK